MTNGTVVWTVSVSQDSLLMCRSVAELHPHEIVWRPWPGQHDLVLEDGVDDLAVLVRQRRIDFVERELFPLRDDGGKVAKYDRPSPIAQCVRVGRFMRGDRVQAKGHQSSLVTRSMPSRSR